MPTFVGVHRRRRPTPKRGGDWNRG